MSEERALDRLLALASIPELADLHPDDLASLAERTAEERVLPGQPCVAGGGAPVRFLVAGRVAAGGRALAAPALVGALEALAGEPLAVSARGDGAHLLAVARDDLRWVMADVFEVWFAVLRHAAARLLAAEPLEAEPFPARRPPRSACPTSLAARIRLLSGGGILGSLRACTLGRLASDAEERTLPARAALWEPGDPASHVGVLVGGSLVSRAGGSVSEPVVHAPGALLGLRETLAGRPRSTRVEAVGGARVLRLAGEALLDELEDDYDAAARLLDALVRQALRAERPLRGLGR